MHEAVGELASSTHLRRWLSLGHPGGACGEASMMEEEGCIADGCWYMAVVGTRWSVQNTKSPKLGFFKKKKTLCEKRKQTPTYKKTHEKWVGQNTAEAWRSSTKSWWSYCGTPNRDIDHGHSEATKTTEEKKTDFVYAEDRKRSQTTSILWIRNPICHSYSLSLFSTTRSCLKRNY